MSLIQSSVALFLMITIVSCVSFTSTKSTEVKASTEVEKDNDLYNIASSALLHRVKMNNVDEVQIKARVKKTAEKAREASKLPAMKLLGLMVMTFRNIFSKRPFNKEPPLSPDVAVEPFVKMTKNEINALKKSVGYKV